MFHFFLILVCLYRQQSEGYLLGIVNFMVLGSDPLKG